MGRLLSILIGGDRPRFTLRGPIVLLALAVVLLGLSAPVQAHRPIVPTIYIGSYFENLLKDTDKDDLARAVILHNLFRPPEHIVHHYGIPYSPVIAPYQVPPYTPAQSIPIRSRYPVAEVNPAGPGKAEGNSEYKIHPFQIRINIASVDPHWVLVLEVMNSSKHPMPLNFTNTQEFDFALKDLSTEQEVWRWSQGRNFGDSRRTVWLEPSESKKYSARVTMEELGMTPNNNQYLLTGLVMSVPLQLKGQSYIFIKDR